MKNDENWSKKIEITYILWGMAISAHPSDIPLCP